MDWRRASYRRPGWRSTDSRKVLRLIIERGVTSRDLDRHLLWLIGCTALQLSCARSLSRTPAPDPSRAAKASPNPNPPKASAVTFVSAEIRGYLGPCGRAQPMLDGIPKSVVQVREARRSSPPLSYTHARDALF